MRQGRGRQERGRRRDETLAALAGMHCSAAAVPWQVPHHPSQEWPGPSGKTLLQLQAQVVAAACGLSQGGGLWYEGQGKRNNGCAIDLEGNTPD